MNIKIYKPYTSTMRNRSVMDFTYLSKKKPEKSLITLNHRVNGRNNYGRITSRHKGGGHKRCYRLIDFKRNKYNIKGKVIAIEYDPNRNTNIALISYADGEKRYIIHPEMLTLNDLINSGKDIEVTIGSALPLKSIPLGTYVHNIELFPKKGGQIIRAAGTYAQILAKEKNMIILSLASKEIRFINENCYATVGKISNSQIYNILYGKAGRKRWLGIRPTVRGSAMNVIDHPHGGGEGRCPIGKSRPLTPWGKPTMGVKTRKHNAKSNMFIIHSRIKI